MNETQFDYKKYPRKLNLGCGFDKRPGYLNVDLQEFHKPDLLCDVRRLPMLPSEYYDEIVASDVLEHLPRLETRPVLEEWNRLLRTGGILKLRAPNLVGLLELFNWADKQSVKEQKNLVQCLFGTQAYEGDYHFTGFTRVLIEHYLRKTGFSITELRIRDHWLFEIVAEKCSEPARYDTGEGDDEEFVREMYQTFLQRGPDEEDLAYYLSALRTQSLSRSTIVEIFKDTDEENDGKSVSGIDLSTTVSGCGEADAKRADTVPLPLFSETKITSFSVRDFIWRYATKSGSIIKKIPIVRTIAEKCYCRILRSLKF